jgi:hypothetical protein
MLTGAAKSRRDCSKKARFSTEAVARACGTIKLAKNEATKSLWPYACPHCSRWHLTSILQPSPPITAKASGIFAAFANHDTKGQGSKP